MGREERDAPSRYTVESADEDHRLAADSFHSPFRDGDAGPGGQRQGDGLPQDDVDIVLLAGKLGEDQVSVMVANGCFRSRPAEGGARRDQQSQVFVILFLVGQPFGRGEKTGKLDERGDAHSGNRGEERTAGLCGKAQRALPRLIVHAQQEVRLEQGRRHQPLFFGASPFCAAHEHSTPSVGG